MGPGNQLELHFLGGEITPVKLISKAIYKGFINPFIIGRAPPIHTHNPSVHESTSGNRPPRFPGPDGKDSNIFLGGLVNRDPYNPYHAWYIYIWLIFMVNVGKYSNPMDGMGNGLLIPIYLGIQ